MKFRIPPIWWPILTTLSPLIFPVLIIKNRIYKKNLLKAKEINDRRIRTAEPPDLPLLENIELTILVEEKACQGFLKEPGISYLIRTNRGSLLYDVGFGEDHKVLSHNAGKLGITFEDIDALAISHLHPDHMGGKRAALKKQVIVPKQLGSTKNKLCYIPSYAEAEGLKTEIITGPKNLTGGIVSMGPLARSLFFFGYTEEQILIARIKNKGLVIFTGCGHPTIEVIIDLAQKLSTEPIYAICGGLHFPISQSRLRYRGIQVQMLGGTGIPPWKRLQNRDLEKAIDAINKAEPEYVYLSAHDSCDEAIESFNKGLNAKTIILEAGATYKL